MKANDFNGEFFFSESEADKIRTYINKLGYVCTIYWQWRQNPKKLIENVKTYYVWMPPINADSGVIEITNSYSLRKALGEIASEKIQRMDGDKVIDTVLKGEPIVRT